MYENVALKLLLNICLFNLYFLLKYLLLNVSILSYKAVSCRNLRSIFATERTEQAYDDC